MTGKLIPVTPRQLGMYLDCPRAYRHHYVDEPRPPRWTPPWAHLGVGNAVHLALAAWWDLPDRDRTPAAGARLVAERWPADGFRDAAQSAAVLARAQSWVRVYLINLDPYARPVGIERTVSARTDTLNLSGKADRIDRRPGGLVVVDYKTGRRPLDPGDAAASYALAIYVLAAGRTLNVRCTRAELHHLPTGDVVTVDYDRERLFRQIDRITDVAGEIQAARDTAAGTPAVADELFPTRPGPLCATCPFRPACPTGQAAAAPAEPWHYLEEINAA